MTYSFFSPDELDEGVLEEDPPDDPEEDDVPEEDEELELLSLDDVEGVEEELVSDLPSALVSVVFP
ncbi:hypothetical protein [Nitrospira sp. M1]